MCITIFFLLHFLMSLFSSIMYSIFVDFNQYSSQIKVHRQLYRKHYTIGTAGYNNNNNILSLYTTYLGL